MTPGRIPLNDVLAEMRDQLGGLLPTTESTRAGCIVQCATAEMRDRFLHFSGWEFEGQSIEVTRYEYEMSSEETFEFFLQRLRVDQELSATRATYGCTADAEISQNSPQSRTPPTKVTIVEPAVSRDKRQTCGDSGKGTATGIVSWVDQKETVRRPPKGSAESRDRQARAVEAQVAQALASRAFEQSSPRTSPRTRDDWGKTPPSAAQKGKGKGKGKGSTNRPDSPARAKFPVYNGRQLTPEDGCWKCILAGKDGGHDYKSCTVLLPGKSVQAILEKLQGAGAAPTATNDRK